MNCPNQRKLCNHLIISDAVTFTDGNLLINLPQANYNNNERYCIVVAQNLPAATTITAPVANIMKLLNAVFIIFILRFYSNDCYC